MLSSIHSRGLPTCLLLPLYFPFCTFFGGRGGGGGVLFFMVSQIDFWKTPLFFIF